MCIERYFSVGADAAGLVDDARLAFTVQYYMRDPKKPSGRGKTPLMRQYYRIKDRHKDAILLFRMGDFYETFEEDAVTTSEVLGIALTKRSSGAASEVKLAGFPYHALDNHLPKLIQAGYRVAICEQLEDSQSRGKVVRRGVTEVVTPGISFHDRLLSPTRSNYLAGVHWGPKNLVGLAVIDASTGEFLVHEVDDSKLIEILELFCPAEVLIDGRHSARLGKAHDWVVTSQDDWIFRFDFAHETLLDHFSTHSLKGFGVDDLKVGLVAAGAVLHYLGETQQGRLPHVRRITRYASDDYMALDQQTRRNLELVASLHDGRPDGTLIEILDETLTPMGARLLRRWLTRPLRNVVAINERLDAVEALLREHSRRQGARALLRGVGDLERLAARVSTGRATPRGLVSLGISLKQIPGLKNLFEHEPCRTLQELVLDIESCEDAVGEIDRALVEDPPATPTRGGMFKAGYNAEIDELRSIARSGKAFVAQMQQEESERTGIPSLKVGFNKVFGYYLEITNTHRDKVPNHYIRKQTLINAERYITPELKEWEEQILTAEERLVSLENELFGELCRRLTEETPAIQQSASLIAALDCFCSFAEIANRGGYCRPRLDESLVLEIKNGRHPVVERSLPAGEPFIPNSISLDAESTQIYIITGPNMAGKSVVLRQVGLIVLLAQVGCFVPAESAHIGVTDRVFTRVGALDNLAAGESTFLVEMNETANILNNATERSLILLDEVGRGTSTFDGLSIAWALVEFLHNHREVAARTLFATHYHELNELSSRLERVCNYRIQVQEYDGRVIFLRKLVPGAADHSYGIEVARMAGLPPVLIERARSVLEQLESEHLEVNEPRDRTAAVLRAIRAKLMDVHPNRMTPIEALITLSDLKDILADPNE